MIHNQNFNVGNSPLIGWDNLLPQGTVTATSSAAGYPVTGLLNGVTTDPWRPDAMPATVTVELPTQRYASMLCFAAHDMGTQGVTVILERLVAAVWTHVMTVAPSDDAPLILSFNAVQSDDWRVRFTGENTFKLSVISLSLGLILPGRILPPHVPLHRVSEVELVGDSESGTGEFLQADFNRTGGRASINLSVQLPDFATGEEFEAFRQHYNRGRPFFMASFPSYEPQDVGYLWRAKNAGSILTPYRDAVFMSIGMECSVYVG